MKRKNGFPNNPTGDDQLLSRYKQLTELQAQADVLRLEILRRARKRGIRRDGQLVLFGARNYAVLVREASRWVKRHFRKAGWKIAKTEVKK